MFTIKSSRFALLSVVFFTAFLTGNSAYAAVSPDADASRTTITTPSSTFSAGSSQNNIITIQVKDSQGANTSGSSDVITLSQTGSAILSTPIPSGKNNGVYTATITATKAEDIVINGTLNGSDISNSAKLSIVPWYISTKVSTISVSAPTVVADGISSVTITLQAKDINGNNLTDIVESNFQFISLSTTGSAKISQAINNHDGTYTAIISNTVTEEVTINVDLVSEVTSTFADTPKVTFTSNSSAANTTITPPGTPITAGSNFNNTITVQIKDTQGNNTFDNSDIITLSASDGATVSTVTPSGNGDGVYTATITTTLAGDLTISGTLNGTPIGNSATLSVVPGYISRNLSTISLSSSTVIADGISSATITLQAIDAFGNQLTDIDSETFNRMSLIKNNGSVTTSISPNANNHDGTYTATISSSAAETVTIGATILTEGPSPFSNTAQLTFTPEVGSPINSTITSSLSTLIANGDTESIITIQAISALGNNVTSGGLTIELAVGNSSASISNVTDNQDGTYTASITHTVAETVTISGTLNGSTMTNSVNLTFIPGSISTDLSTITVSPPTVIADGVSSAIITVQAIDEQGNNVTSGGMGIALTADGDAAVGPVTDHKNGTYTATVTNVTAETVNISGTLDSAPLTNVSTVKFIPGSASTNRTTISVSEASVVADGQSLSTITVQTKDSQGNNITSGGQTITLAATGSGKISDVTDNRDGSYTATVTNTVAENITINAILNTVQMPNFNTVAFIPGPAAATQTIITASPASVVADGLTISTITVQTKDAQNNNLTGGNQRVTLTTSGSANISDVSDNGDGTYSATITNATPETVTINGTINELAIANSDDIIFTPGTASHINSTILVAASSVIADGSSNTIITLQTKDTQNNNLSTGGDQVSFTTTGVANISVVSDNGDGTYTATITSVKAEPVTIEATLNGSSLSSPSLLTFIPGPASATHTTISTSPTSIVADGSTLSTITVQTKDAQGNNLTSGNQTITLTANGSGIVGNVINNGDGTYSATISNTSAERVTISGKLDTVAITDTSEAIFVTGIASATNSVLSVSDITVIADGTSNIIISLQTQDAQNNNLSTGGDQVSFTTTGVANISVVSDNGDGTYTATITSVKAEPVTIEATLNGSSLSSPSLLTFIPGPASATHTTISTSPTSIVADGSTLSTITVQTKDAQGNNLTSGNQTITLTANGSGIIGNVIDNGDGTYSATVTNTVEEPISISGTVNGQPIVNTETIQFVAGSADASQTTLVTNLATLPADGTSIATITVQTKDAQGNNLSSGGAPVILSQDGNATLSALTDNNDGTYSATIINTEGEVVTIKGTLNGSDITSSVEVSFSAINTIDTVSFVDANYLVTEGTTSVTIKATRIGNGNGAASVEMALTNTGNQNNQSRAVQGSDFTLPASLVFEWADNETGEKEIEIQLISNSSSNTTKTFEFSLQDELELELDASHSTTTIQLKPEPDGIGFAKSSFRAAEEIGSVEIQVVRSGTGAGAVQISVIATDGNDDSRDKAQPGDDYILNNSMVVNWADGEIGIKTLSIDITADNGDADGEYFILELDQSTLIGDATLVVASKEAEVVIFEHELLGNIIKETSKVKPVADALDTICENIDSNNSAAISECAYLSSLDEAGIEKALDKALPKTVEAQIQSSVELAGNQLKNMRRRLTELRSGQNKVSITGLNMSLFSENVPLTAAMQSMVNDSVGGSAGADGDLLGSPWGAFINGTITIGSQDNVGDSLGYDMESKGITAGVDYRITPKIILGGAIGFGASESEFNQNSGKQDASNISFIVFGNHFINNKIYADWVASYSINSFKIDRKLESNGTIHNISSSPDGQQFSLAFGGGYDYVRGPLQLTGSARIDYINSTIDSYTESDDFYALTISKQSDVSTDLALGIKSSYVFAIKSGVIIPSAELEWVHEFKGKDRKIKAAFAQSPSAGSFEVVSEGSDSAHLNAAFSLTGTFSNGKSAYFRYDTLLNESDRSSESFTLGGRYEF